MLLLLLVQPAHSSPERPETVTAHLHEKQVFTLKFIDTTAGECELETMPDSTWQSQPAQHLRATVRTIGFFRLFYPFTEVVDVYIEKAQGAPLFVDINIHDRDKLQHTQIRLDGKTLRGEEIEDSTEPGAPPNHRKKMWNITPGAQSIFSILPFLRMQALAPGSQVTFPISHDERNGNFHAEVLGAESIHVAGGDENAVKVRVGKEFTDTFYDSSAREEPLLWFSNDSNKQLLRFEFKHRRGKLIAILKSQST
ncbi:MAG: DUF3108 domain-containing protein [Deltaproteobacteria bacterium]|nr:DUF3108 domain-containing protein [Deltaproteobacteria bacterium]